MEEDKKPYDSVPYEDVKVPENLGSQAVSSPLTMDLADTIKLMVDADHKQRLKAEVYQLEIRMNKLGNILDNFYQGTLDFVPSCPILLLEKQYDAMQEYMRYLLIRCDIEEVRL